MVPPVHSDPSLDPADLLAACPQLADAKRLVIGFSGGLDSTVLLHLISMLRDSNRLQMPIVALHVNHGLQAAADGWQQHCVTTCERLHIPMLAHKVSVELAGKESPEEAARYARYAVFAETIGQGDVLLLAHHLDDQVETVLF